MPQKTTAVIFDCFGVLYQDAFKQFLDEYATRLPHPRQHYYELAKQNEFGYLSDDDFYHEFSQDSGLPAEELRQRFNDTNCLNISLVPLIEDLRKTGKYKIGMLSNVERGFLQKFLDNHNVGHLFDTVLTSSETVHVKPEREIFEVMAERLNVPFKEWFFIDDGPDNIAAAERYGIPSHLYTTSTELRSALQAANILEKGE